MEHLPLSSQWGPPLFSPNDQLVAALRYMGEKDFYQVVIQDNGNLSLLTVEGVAKWVEQQAGKDVIRVTQVKVKDAHACDIPGTFEVMGHKNTLYDAREAFRSAIEKVNPRLFAIIITQSGKANGKPIGIVTPWDLKAEEPQVSDCVFRKEGEFSTITYERKTIRLKDAKGLHYIAFLLQNAWKQFHILELISAVEKHPPLGGEAGYEIMRQKQLDREGLSIIAGDPREKIDEKARIAYEKRLEFLREELQKAEM